MKDNCEFNISFTLGRTDEKHWEVFDSEDIAFWESNLGLISFYSYEYKGCSINVRTEWSVIVERLKQHYKYMSDLYSYQLADSSIIFNRTVDVPVSIEIIKGSDSIDFNYFPGFILEHYCYEIFTVLNLSRPGVCDFFNLSYDDHKIKLSSYNFQYAWELSFENKEPKLYEIPLGKVIEWYRGINIGFKQKASSPIEKSIFSLMHFCGDGDDVNNVMWIFHSLETMFSTRVGEGFSNLIERMSFLLKLDLKNKTILKKRFRKLYDLRNSLIHGGYEIYHPMRFDVMDDSLDSQLYEMYENLQFGISIVIACIQNMIINGWYGGSVEEKISGRLMP